MHWRNSRLLKSKLRSAVISWRHYCTPKTVKLTTVIWLGDFGFSRTCYFLYCNYNMQIRYEQSRCSRQVQSWSVVCQALVVVYMILYYQLTNQRAVFPYTTVTSQLHVIIQCNVTMFRYHITNLHLQCWRRKNKTYQLFNKRTVWYNKNILYLIIVEFVSWSPKFSIVQSANLARLTTFL